MGKRGDFRVATPTKNTMFLRSLYPGENPALQVSRLTSKGRAPRVKVLKDAEELKLLGHEVPGGWLCMVVLVCWMSQNVGCLYGVVLS